MPPLEVEGGAQVPPQAPVGVALTLVVLRGGAPGQGVRGRAAEAQRKPPEAEPERELEAATGVATLRGGAVLAPGGAVRLLPLARAMGEALGEAKPHRRLKDPPEVATAVGGTAVLEVGGLQARGRLAAVVGAAVGVGAARAPREETEGKAVLGAPRLGESRRRRRGLPAALDTVRRKQRDESRL